MNPFGSDGGAPLSPIRTPGTLLIVFLAPPQSGDRSNWKSCGHRIATIRNRNFSQNGSRYIVFQNYSR